MTKIMSVKELKALLENIPDDYLVYSLPLNGYMLKNEDPAWRVGRIVSHFMLPSFNAVVLRREVE